MSSAEPDRIPIAFRTPIKASFTSIHRVPIVEKHLDVRLQPYPKPEIRGFLDINAISTDQIIKHNITTGQITPWTSLLITGTLSEKKRKIVEARKKKQAKSEKTFY